MALTATELDLKTNQKRLDSSVMALEALRNVIKNNAGIISACVTLTCHSVPLWAEDCVTDQKYVIAAVLTIAHGVLSVRVIAAKEGGFDPNTETNQHVFCFLMHTHRSFQKVDCFLLQIP